MGKVIEVEEGLYSEEEKAAILERAKGTEYKHARFFKEGGKTVDFAMEYYARGDFYLDFTGKDLGRIKGFLPSMFSQGIPVRSLSRKDVVNYCINTKQWNPLVLRYVGKEGGTDRGKLKIETYLIKKGIV